MRKLFNNRFLFILASSLTVLIILGIGAFYLFDDADDTFVKSGYVLNPLSSTVEKYFFDEDVSYKENLSSMIEFNDIDDKKVSVLKDSFLHYMDGSLSFLKNGAILDLNSIRGTGAVNFYNITNQSIIEKNDNGYVIENISGDINLSNFIGRISDNKYIVVGNLSAKIAGNSTNISGDYFEIVYVEEGVVNIENKDVKYQVTAEGTVIYVGNDIEINLGDKKIVRNNEDIMSITAITIAGDENIEIIPKAPEDDEEPNGENGSGDGTGTGGNNGNGTGNGEGTGGNGTGTGETGSSDNPTLKNDDIVVTLKDAVIGSTSIDVTFDIINATEEDNFVLKVTNIDTGRTVDMEPVQVISDNKIIVNLITPSTKYLFTVYNGKDGNKYFQKIFETTDFGIKLEKVYSTDSSIAYKITVDEGTEINNARLKLYKYDEELMSLVPVTTSYYDSALEKDVVLEKEIYLSSLEGNIEGVHEIIFDGLDSNTIYTAVLDEFSLASSNFKDLYNITLTSMTLKQTPKFANMKVSKNNGAGIFTLSLGTIEDPDNAIINYTYNIYEVADQNNVVIDPIVKTNASPVDIKIGEGKNQLKNDTNYFYKVVIEYFDNEKYIEYTTEDFITFVMGSEPYITVEKQEVSYDKIKATIYLTDNSCLISMPDRTNCQGVNTTKVVVSEVNSNNGELKDPIYKTVDFTVNGNEIKYDLELSGLKENTTYQIDVMAEHNDDLDSGAKKIEHTEDDDRRITTKTLASFIATWDPKASGADHVVNIQTKFVPEEGTGTLSPEETANSIKKVVIKLYEGAHKEDILAQIPIAEKVFYNTGDFNIKENFYDNGYTITTDGTFGLDIDDLKEHNVEGKLSEFYTISIAAYYDESETNQVRLSNSSEEYQISEILLLENVKDPIIKVSEIKKSMENVHPDLNDIGTVVGYSATASVDSVGLNESNLKPKTIKWYVYNSNKELVKFYVKDDSGDLVLTDSFIESLTDDWNGFATAEIYMGYGTEYFVNDTVMNRGNEYYIGYVIEVKTDKDESLNYPTLKNVENSPSDFGIYSTHIAQKESPKLGMYIAKSTENTITYRYQIKDPDNALYRDNENDSYGFYYKINDGSEKKLDLVLANGEYQFSGEVTIEGLANGNLYSLYYKRNVTKTGVFEQDVLNYLDGEDDGVRLFDGYYDANDSKYNFNFEVINNPDADNKVYIKILADEEMLNRIISYRVTLKDMKGNTYTPDEEIWKLSVCPNEEVTDEDGNDLVVTPRCFSVDYNELKSAGMKSNQNERNLITVLIDAVYDNGLTGYDYKVGENGDYQYMIFQNNNTANEYGNYISYNKDGKVKVWTEELGVSKGYYTYTLSNGNLIGIKNSNSKFNTLSVRLSTLGYTSTTGEGILNPKMISIDTMGSDNNKFMFSSITPKVNALEVAQLINGAVYNLTLSGADLSDFVKEEDGYYLYVETYNANSISTGTLDPERPTLKLKINEDKPDSSIRAQIDLLNPGREYYFKVYAYMYKNGEPTKLQLFHAGYTDRYEAKSYYFKTLGWSDMYLNYSYTFSVNKDKEYGSRDLTLKTVLNPYRNGVSYNFDFGYVIYTESVNCIPYEIENGTCYLPYVVKGNIDHNELKSNIVHVSDISDSVLETDFEFNRKYTTYIYAIYDTYNTITDRIEKGYLIFNNYEREFSIDSLNEPEFTVTREALILEGANEDDSDDYAIELGVSVNDPHETLVDGKYYIKLLDADGRLAGKLQVLNEDGNYVTVSDYENYAFDARSLNTKVRIIDLEANTKYVVSVYSKAYINNYSETISVENRIYDVDKTHTVYTANDYGIAFGDLDYGLTENSLVVTFLGGSSFKDVALVEYTIGLWENNQSTSTFTGEYIIGDGNKSFELNTDTGNYRFVIEPDGMKNTEGQTYLVTTRYSVLDGLSEDNSIKYKMIYEYSYRTTYVKEQTNQKK